MGKLRVLIVGDGGIVDIQEFEDPRVRYIEDFNQLNKSTQFTAVLPLTVDARPAGGRGCSSCRPKRRCGLSH